MSDSNKIKMKGKVLETFSNNLCKVQLENNVIINAHISGKMRMCKIRILPGDTVEVELSPYDLTCGRIIYRAN